MLVGVLYGLSACALWGIVYLMPLFLPQYDSLYLAIGRAFVMGAVSVGIVIGLFSQFRVLSQKDWRFAAKLTLIGNLLQAWFVMLSVSFAGVAVAGICFGAVPVLVALISNERDKRMGKPYVSLKKLSLPLLCIVIGFIAINATELEVFLRQGEASSGSFFFGLVCGLISTAMWTWYPIRNADWLLAHPQVSPVVWTCAQSVVLLPVSTLLYLAVWYFDDSMPSLLGVTPWRFVFFMLLAGVCCAWLAATLWNACSAKLPTALVGQLLVFETIFSVVYGQIWRMEWPTLTLCWGFALLLIGISVSLRFFNQIKSNSI